MKITENSNLSEGNIISKIPTGEPTKPYFKIITVKSKNSFMIEAIGNNPEKPIPNGETRAVSRRELIKSYEIEVGVKR